VNLVDRIKVFPSEVSDLPLTIEGELNQSVFELKNYDVQASTHLKYHLELTLFETELLVRGQVSITFEAECSRCWKLLSYDVVLEDLVMSIEVDEEDEVYDLTDELREEVLIELPQYFTCARVLGGDECEVNYPQKNVDKDTKDVVEELPSQSEDSRWAGLDAWNNPADGED